MGRNVVTYGRSELANCWRAKVGPHCGVEPYKEILWSCLHTHLMLGACCQLHFPLLFVVLELEHGEAHDCQQVGRQQEQERLKNELPVSVEDTV